MSHYERFGARIFFLENGDIVVKQTVREHITYRTQGAPVIAPAGEGQTERLMSLLRLARAGELAKGKKKPPE